MAYNFMANQSGNLRFSTVISLGIIIFGGFVWYSASSKPPMPKPQNLTVTPESEAMIRGNISEANQIEPKAVASVTETKSSGPTEIGKSNARGVTSDSPIVLANDSAKAPEVKSSDNNSEIPDTFVPILYDIEATEITDVTAVIHWTTREPATSKIFIGHKTPLNLKTASSMTNAELEYDHFFELADLTPNTKYYFVLESKDAAGNVGTSIEAPFQTKNNQ